MAKHDISADTHKSRETIGLIGRWPKALWSVKGELCVESGKHLGEIESALLWSDTENVLASRTTAYLYRQLVGTDRRHLTQCNWQTCLQNINKCARAKLT